jgi:hypothetical protein
MRGHNGSAGARASKILALAVLAALAMAWSTTGASLAASRTDIKEIVVEEALATTVPPSLALAVAKVESDFQARALSLKGARGVMQIMPATATGEFGVDADELWDARLNVQLGIDFLGRLIKRYGGRWDLALSHYNGGRVVGSGARAKPLPATRKYVDSVLRWQRRYAAQARVWRAAPPGRSAWRPARTRVAAAPRPAAPPPIIVRALPDHVPARARRSRAHTLDDFGENIERRRRRLRIQLDDFAAGRYSNES